MVRLDLDPEALKPQPDDLEALANAVREIGKIAQPETVEEVARKGHLRVLRNVENANPTREG